MNEWTLRAHLKDIGPRSNRPVHGKRLDDDLEHGLLLYIKKMDEIGIPLQPEAVNANANRILARHHEDPTTEPEPVGEKWSTQFLQRYPGFSIGFPETLDVNLFKAMQPKVFRVYYERLGDAWKEYNIHPSDCYNIDETGFRIVIGGKQKATTCDARRQAFAPSSTNRDFATTVKCVSTDKAALPPFMILPGKNMMEK